MSDPKFPPMPTDLGPRGPELVGKLFAERGGWRDRAETAEARVRELEAAIRYWAEEEPLCNCGEFSPGPCCAACRADRALRATLSPSEETK